MLCWCHVSFTFFLILGNSPRNEWIFRRKFNKLSTPRMKLLCNWKRGATTPCDTRTHCTSSCRTQSFFIWCWCLCFQLVHSEFFFYQFRYSIGAMSSSARAQLIIVHRTWNSPWGLESYIDKLKTATADKHAWDSQREQHIWKKLTTLRRVSTHCDSNCEKSENWNRSGLKLQCIIAWVVHVQKNVTIYSKLCYIVSINFLLF